MANRAYLFSSDRPDGWKRPDEDYYDSRWTIPLAWFFFFRPHNIQMVDVHCGGSDWEECKLSGEKQICLDLFALRQPLLLSLIGDYPTREMISRFLAKVETQPGRFLMMDPGEVLGDIGQHDESDATMFASILSLLDSGEGRSETIREATSPFVGELSQDPDRRECRVIGYTYC